MNKIANNKKGFVVIGTCIVCMSLIAVATSYFTPSYHSKSSSYNIDNRIKASLSDLGAGGELYYDGHNKTYKGFCNSSFIDDAQKNILEKCSRKNIERITCNDSSKAWCAYSSEIYGDRVFCVDSLGFRGELLEHNCDQGFSCKSE